MTRTDADLLASALEATGSVIASVRPEQAHLPTPCSDFDVTQLVDHVVGWARSFAERFASGSEAGDPSGYRAGPDPAAEFGEASRSMVASYRAATAATQQLPVGFLLMEFLTHGWDLAIATDHQLVVDDDVAELALATGRQMLKPEYRGQDKTFGHEVHVSGSAGAVDRLVAFMGRDPGWSPPS